MPRDKNERYSECAQDIDSLMGRKDMHRLPNQSAPSVGLASCAPKGHKKPKLVMLTFQKEKYNYLNLVPSRPRELPA